ncbi:MAG: hypothetical protein O2895_06070 [Chloroflexi bacterium]|nr:hypothetical protein [Chloroflexota bacterium]
MTPWTSGRLAQVGRQQPRSAEPQDAIRNRFERILLGRPRGDSGPNSEAAAQRRG